MCFRGKGRAFLWLGVCTCLAGFAHFSVVWNHFYAGVPKLFDAGWYAALVHRQTPALENPATVVFGTIPESFYATHFSPALWLLSLPSYLLPLGPVEWLAVLEGVKHALIVLVTAAALCGLLAEERVRTRLDGFGWGLILLLAPFNGVLLAAASYPHFETWFVPAALAFLILLFRRQYRWAVLAMLGTLLLREDMGFHLCGLLLLAALLALWERRTFDAQIRGWLVFAGIGFVCSAVALLIGAVLFPGDDAFRRIYLGEPALAHLRAELLGERLLYMLGHRGYLWLPLLVLLVWAIRVRGIWMLLGYLAFVPWFVLHFLAYHRPAGTLDLYYAFPYALALLWPLASGFVFERDRSGARQNLCWTAIALLASVAGFAFPAERLSLLSAMLGPELGTRTALQATVERLSTEAEEGVPLVLDDGLLAHRPGAFQRQNHFFQSTEPSQLVAFYRNGRQLQIAWETGQSLPHAYGVGTSRVVVLSARPLDWPHLNWISSERLSLRPFLHVPEERFHWAGGPGHGAHVGWRAELHFVPAMPPYQLEWRLWMDPGEAGVTESLTLRVHDIDGREHARLRVHPDEWQATGEVFRLQLRMELEERLQRGIRFAIEAPPGTRGGLEDLLLESRPWPPVNPLNENP